MELEKQFMQLENDHPEFPRGKRYRPYAGREPGNTLIWESEFETLGQAQEALSFLENDSRHEELFQKQVQFFQEAYTEIYESID